MSAGEITEEELAHRSTRCGLASPPLPAEVNAIWPRTELDWRGGRGRCDHGQPDAADNGANFSLLVTHLQVDLEVMKQDRAAGSQELAVAGGGLAKARPLWGHRWWSSYTATAARRMWTTRRRDLRRSVAQAGSGESAGRGRQNQEEAQGPWPALEPVWLGPAEIFLAPKARFCSSARRLPWSADPVEEEAVTEAPTMQSLPTIPR